jgi:protein tyrosine/serine phosphatase
MISGRYGAQCSALQALIVTFRWSFTAQEARIGPASCAALLLKVLGVSEADIIADHDLSNLYNAERLQPIYARFAAMGIDAQKAAPYLQAPLEPLIAMFEHLKKNYGTVEDYLLKKAGLGEKTLADLRAILLQ